MLFKQRILVQGLLVNSWRGPAEDLVLKAESDAVIGVGTSVGRFLGMRPSAYFVVSGIWVKSTRTTGGNVEVEAAAVVMFLQEGDHCLIGDALVLDAIPQDCLIGRTVIHTSGRIYLRTSREVCGHTVELWIRVE